MSEICDLTEIVEKLKDILSRHITCNKVYDWHVADVLHISDMSLATMKKRNKIPFEKIILFCDRCGLDPRDIILKKKSC